MVTTKQKLIIVTGASSGIGYATALLLAESGYHIIAVGRNTKKLSALKKHVSSKKGFCEVFNLDITNRVQRDIFFKILKSRFNRINGLINSAGYLSSSHRKENVELTINTNVVGLIEMCNGIKKLMTNGTIINVSSTASLSPNSHYPVYSASKAAINAFTLAEAEEQEKGISFFVVCPGPTNTPMRAKTDKEAHLKQSPVIVAQTIKNVLENRKSYKNGDIVIIAKETESLLRKK